MMDEDIEEICDNLRTSQIKLTKKEKQKDDKEKDKKKLKESTDNTKKKVKGSADDIVISAPSGFKRLDSPSIPSKSTKPSLALLKQQQQQESLKKEKVYFKVSEQLLDEVAHWEATKSNYTRSVQELLNKKSESLEYLFREYLSEIEPLLNQYQLDPDLKNDILQREHARLEEAKQKLFGSRNASIDALESQIATRKREIIMHNKITLIQSVVRGWLAKKRYKDMLARIERRNRCIKEIIETERSYVASLELVITQFLQPLQTTKKDLLTTNEVSLIFSNCSALYGVHKELLASLEERWSQWNNRQSIADCFLSLIPYLKLYTQYINNFNQSLQTLNECKKRDAKINNFFFKDCKSNPTLQNKDFLDLQIQPVQRIPRYKLLFTELLHNTPKIHSDYELINQALKAIQNVAISINESKRNAEGLEKMIQIQGSLTTNIELVQPHRRHIKDGVMLYERRGKLKERYIFLFSDSLLVCKKVMNLFDNSPRYDVVTLMDLKNSIILPAEDQDIKHGFAVLGTEHLYFYARSAVEQYEWIEILKHVVKDWETSQSTLKKDEEIPMVKEHSRESMMVKENSVINPNRISKRYSEHSTSNLSEKLANQPIVIERNSTLSSSVSSASLNSSLSTSSLSFGQPGQLQQSISLSPVIQQQNPNQLPILPPLVTLNNQQIVNSLPGIPTQVQPTTSFCQNKSIREIGEIFDELCILHAQLFEPITKLQTLFGNPQLPTSGQFGEAIFKLKQLLKKLEDMKQRSIDILRDEAISQKLQDSISSGKNHIGTLNDWIRSYCHPNDPNSQQARATIINLMKWYNNLFTIWKSIIDYEKK